ncbi:hypothetical protein Ahy_B10g102894 isoform A [Arachis hypogaea]|uniref:Uncharacterized protein n=1 Tax=Arachis hypogaea TaxID=3818 RepID=A0A444X2U7_ARAHY|nr:hypothetical protein Ahy_B10g102894 isoform A [Arachis hypogaea]
MGKPNKTHRVLYDSNEEKIRGFGKNTGGSYSEQVVQGCKGLEIETPPQSTEGHQGRLLRYGALCWAMSVVAKLGSEDAAELVVARDSIANLTELLQRRAYEWAGGHLGLSSLSELKDSVVSKTNGALMSG